MPPLRANLLMRLVFIGLALVLVAGVGIVVGVQFVGSETTPDRTTILETTLRVVHAIAERSNDEICSRFPQVVHASAFCNGQRSCGALSDETIRILTDCGIATRGVNLYNLPNQGNHSLLEVQLDENEWMLVDPTFGVVFLPDIAGRGWSLDEVRGLPNENAVTAILLRSTSEESWARPVFPGFRKAATWLLATT